MRGLQAPRWWEPVLWLLVALFGWFTVGPVPGAVLFVLVAAHRVLSPDRRVLSSAGAVLAALVPVTWFVGSSLPMWPPVTRLNDNILTHQVAGLAMWTIFLAALVEVRSHRGDDSP